MTKRLNETTAQMDCAIGYRIRSMRQLRGMSQMALAEKLGITFQQVQKYEKGTNRVAASTLVIICHALQADPLEILGLQSGGIESSAFADLMRHCRTLELRLARIRRVLADGDDSDLTVTQTVTVDVATHRNGDFIASVRPSAPN